MKLVPDSLLAFQHMFPDDDACAAWLIEMRWPDGFVCPAWAMKRDGRCAEKHTPSSALGCRRQTSVTAGTILHASKLPLTRPLVLGRLPDGDPLQRASLPCSSRNSSVSALTAALGCSPTSCAPAWSTPSATRCRASFGNRRGQPSIPDQRRSSHRRARTQPRRQRLLIFGDRTRGRKHPRPPAAGRNLLYGPPTSDTSSKPPPIPTPSRKPTAGPATLRSPPIATMSMSSKDRRSPRPAVDPPSLLQPQRMGARRLPRAASQASAGLSR